MKLTAHLTKIEGTLLAWSNAKDLQAVRGLDGTERLFYLGKEVRLHPTQDHSPVQIVINYARLGYREAIRFLRFFEENSK